MESKKDIRPEQLLKEALVAPKYPQLAPYFKVVYVLREKGMSWRDIASWLNERGLDVSHTTVRDLHKSELLRLPKPVLDSIIDEIEAEASHLMIESPFMEDEENED